MTNHKRFREQLATYRDLSWEEREALKRQLAGDPAGADLLAAYEAMDRRLADLPAPKPDPSLRRDFYAALEREQTPGRGAWFGRLFRQIPAAAGQLAVVAGLVLLAVGAAYLFRQQFEFAASDVTRTPISTERPTKAAEGTPSPLTEAGTPTPAGFTQPTPTYAVTVPPDDPFGPFREWAAQWPQSTGVAHGALRAGLKEYLRGSGGIGALADSAQLAALEAELDGLLAPAGLQLADVYPGGERELIIAFRPFVDVVTQDDGGILHIRGLGIPAYGPVADTVATGVQVQDVAAFDGQPEIQVTYTVTGDSRVSQEYLIARWDPARTYWQEILRVPLLGADADTVTVDLDPAGGYAAVEVSCQATGPFAATMRRRDLFMWDGSRFVWTFMDRDEPADRHQLAGLAEAYLRSGYIGRAAVVYRTLYQGNVSLPAPDDQMDWEGVAALRAGQLYALLGQPDEVDAALAQASLRSTTIGRLAGRFRDAYADTGDPAGAWVAVLQDEEVQAAIDAGTLTGVELDLVYPGMALAAALQQRDVTNPAGPPDVLGIWAEYGLEVGQGRVEDLDYDGANEVLVTLPAPAGEVPVWLLDRGDDGWFATLLGRQPANAQLAAPQPGPNNAFQVIPVGDEYVGWNGHYRFYYSDTADWEGNWRFSVQPEHRCLLPAEELVPIDVSALPDRGVEVTPVGSPAVEMTPTPTIFPGTPFPSRTPLPAPDILFGDPPVVGVSGHGVSSVVVPGNGVTASFSWFAQTDTIPPGLTFFLHVTDAEGQLVAQADFPLDFPPERWLDDPLISDARTVTIPEDAAEGTVRVWLGVVDATTGERLPATANGAALPENRFLLGEVPVQDGPLPTPTPPPVVVPVSPTPTPTPAGESAATPIAPVAVRDASLRLDSWSPDGHFLAYWEATATDVEAGLQTLRLRAVADGQECRYPRDRYEVRVLPEGGMVGVRHAWVAGNRLLVVDGTGNVSLGQPCATGFAETAFTLPGPIVRIAAVAEGGTRLLLHTETAFWLLTLEGESGTVRVVDGITQTPSEWDGAAFSPAGSYVAVNHIEGGTTVIDTATAQVVQTVDWLSFGGLGRIFAPEWIGEDAFVVRSARDEPGPLLVTVGEDAQPAGPALFGREAPYGASLFAVPTEDSFAALLTAPEPGEVWVYHGATGETEVLAFDGGRFDPAGRWLYLVRRDEGNDYQLWRRPLAPAGAPATRLETLSDYPTFTAAPSGALALRERSRVVVHTPAGGADNHRVWQLEGYSHAQMPLWSPDGDRLAVVGALSGPLQSGLFLIAVP